jgi:glycosyltransferase involved in cell wall biosynthesis
MTNNSYSQFAPIILFVYNRLWHTQQTLDALKKNILAIESDLIVYSDGPKDEKAQAKVAEIRKFLKEITGFKSVRIIEREKNFGLSNNIIDGVSQVIEEYNKVIVLEDDHVTSPYFLKFLNDGLDFYTQNEEVISIHGYVYPIKNDSDKPFFLRGADCWGWATWKRGWDLFDPDGKRLLKKLKELNLQKQFDFNGSYPYVQMLKDQIAGKNNSWAVRWYASAFIENRYTLYPGRTLVQNIGLDGSGTHCGESVVHYSDFSVDPIRIQQIRIIENEKIKEKIERYFRSIQISSMRVFFRKLKILMRKIKCIFVQ